MLRDIIVDPHYPDCPIRNILSRISDRWSMLILLTLDGKQEPIRYSDSARSLVASGVPCSSCDDIGFNISSRCRVSQARDRIPVRIQNVIN